MVQRVDLSTLENIKTEIEVLRQLVDEFHESDYHNNPSTIGFRFGTLGSTFMNMVVGRDSR